MRVEERTRETSLFVAYIRQGGPSRERRAIPCHRIQVQPQHREREREQDKILIWICVSFAYKQRKCIGATAISCAILQ